MYQSLCLEELEVMRILKLVNMGVRAIAIANILHFNTQNITKIKEKL